MLTDLVKQEPSWQDGASLLVEAYAAAGRSAEAVEWLEEAAPDNPRLYATLAEFYGRQRPLAGSGGRLRARAPALAAKLSISGCGMARRC